MTEVTVRRAALLAGLLGTIVLLLIAGASAAPPPRTWTVCPSGCDYTDIQTAIVAGTTMPGDTILIKHSGSPYTVNAGNHIADSGKQLIIEGDPSGPRPVIRD